MKSTTWLHTYKVGLMLTVLVWSAAFQTHGQSAETLGLKPNGNFEIDRDGDRWPDGWAKVNPGGAWLEEDGNHFLRLTSTAPGEMVMLYQEVPIPEALSKDTNSIGPVGACTPKHRP